MGKLRFFSYATLWLWTLIVTMVVLIGGQAMDIAWPLTPKVAFGRLLVHPLVAGIETLLAVLLIVLAGAGFPYKKWIVIAISAVAMVCAFYHLYCYLIGTEWMLAYGAGYLIRDNAKGVRHRT